MSLLGSFVWSKTAATDRDRVTIVTRVTVRRGTAIIQNKAKCGRVQEKRNIARTWARQTDSLTNRLLLRYLVGRCFFHSIRAGVIQARISGLPRSVYFWWLSGLKQLLKRHLDRRAAAYGPFLRPGGSAQTAARVLSGVIRGRSVTGGPSCPPQVCGNMNLVFIHYKTSSSAGKDDTH